MPAQAENGFGSNGDFNLQSVILDNPNRRRQKIYVFHGGNTAPVILFCHAYGATSPDSYIELITHLVSRGYTVIYPQYPKFGTPDRNYDFLWDGFMEAVEKETLYMNTNHITIIGHSLGGGACPRIALNAHNQGWGTESIGMYVCAPWYSLRMTDAAFDALPNHMTTSINVYEDDINVDSAMGVDQFYHSPSNGDKIFNVWRSGEGSFDHLQADHSAFLGKGAPSGKGEEDEIDYLLYFNLDAFLEFTLTRDASAEYIAMDRSSRKPAYWDFNQDLPYIEAPTIPKSINQDVDYKSPWDDPENPRR